MAIDARKSFYAAVFGIKGSGKSEYCYHLFEGYPWDRLIIDVTHDVRSLMLLPRGIPHRMITDPLPASWPEWMRDQDVENGRLTLVYQPDMGASDAAENMDRCVGLCMRGGPPTLCWADEIGEICTEHKTGPSMKQALHHGRHQNLSLLMAGPRSQRIDVLCIGNSDRVVAYRMLNSDDRERIGKNTGADQREFDRDNQQLREYEHMVWQRADYDEGFITYEPIERWSRRRKLPPEFEWTDS